MPVPLTVLVATHERPGLLGRMLESFVECNLPEAYEELIVVENGSFSGAKSLVEQMPASCRARYEYTPRANKSQAMNKGLEKVADDSLVVFFDDDVRVHPHALVAYAEAGAEHGPGSFFGGPARVDYEEEPPEWMVPFFPNSMRGYDLVNTRTGSTYLGLNWAAFAGDVNRLGGFDPRLGLGSAAGGTGEESNLQVRMLAENMQGIDVMDAIVWHYVPKKRMTVKRVLDRKRKHGVRLGIDVEEPLDKFTLNFIRGILVSVGVAAKGLTTLNREKMLFALFNAAQRVGVAEGYLWSHRNKS